MSDPIAAALGAALFPVVRDAVRDALADHDSATLPALLTRSQIAEQLGCSARTVARLDGEGMPVVMVGDSPRYEIAAVLDWLRGREARR